VKCHECGQIQEDVGTLKGSLMKLDEKLEARLVELNGKVEAVEAQIEQELKEEVKEVKDEVKDVKESISKVNKDVDEVKVMINQMFNMLGQLNKLPSPAEGMLNTSREDILIAGGYESGKTTEIYSWEKNGWFDVSSMNKEHRGASSLIYNDQIFVVGGEESMRIDDCR
jgi:chromosome segregation ATPase